MGGTSLTVISVLWRESIRLDGTGTWVKREGGSESDEEKDHR